MNDHRQELAVLVLALLLATATMFRIASCAENEAVIINNINFREQRQ